MRRLAKMVFQWDLMNVKYCGEANLRQKLDPKPSATSMSIATSTAIAT